MRSGCRHLGARGPIRGRFAPPGPIEDVRDPTRTRGPLIAITATAASMLTAIDHMVRDVDEYENLGSRRSHPVAPTRIGRRFVARLQPPGRRLDLEEVA